MRILGWESESGDLVLELESEWNQENWAESSLESESESDFYDSPGIGIEIRNVRNRASLQGTGVSSFLTLWYNRELVGNWNGHIACLKFRNLIRWFKASQTNADSYTSQTGNNNSTACGKVNLLKNSCTKLPKVNLRPDHNIIYFYVKISRLECKIWYEPTGIIN